MTGLLWKDRARREELWKGGEEEGEQDKGEGLLLAD